MSPEVQSGPGPDTSFWGPLCFVRLHLGMIANYLWDACLNFTIVFTTINDGLSGSYASGDLKHPPRIWSTFLSDRQVLPQMTSGRSY
eukprot:scaffold61018_cov52-Cyclotella_meneghiniana.AAC.10